MKSRIFNIMQYEKHPITGADLGFNESNILDGLNHKSIKKYAYIRHDKETYNEKDVQDIKAKFNVDVVLDDVKPAHWHIVLQGGSNQIDTFIIAKWFGISENFVDCPKGAGAFLDCVEYLTHSNEKQQAMGKFRYDDTEVKANFDWQAELLKKAEKLAKYGRDVNDKELYRLKVLNGELTIRQLIKENELAYTNDFSTFEKLRIKFINEKAPMPLTRINYYISGAAGAGKGLISMAIARSLYPQLENDDDIFFIVGSQGALFEGYDGQPVLIWNDYRALELFQALGDRGNIFRVFDTHPTRQKQNIKYSSIMLINEVNIVNSVDDYSTFLDGLAGEYKNNRTGEMIHSEMNEKMQSYRRFPFIIPLHKEDFDIMLNKGFMDQTDEFDQYRSYKHVAGNMQKIAVRCGRNEALLRQIQTKTVQPIADLHQDLIENVSSSQDVLDDTAAILAEFADYGKTPEDIQIEQSKSALAAQGVVLNTLADIRREKRSKKASNEKPQKVLLDAVSDIPLCDTPRPCSQAKALRTDDRDLASKGYRSDIWVLLNWVLAQYDKTQDYSYLFEAKTLYHNMATTYELLNYDFGCKPPKRFLELSKLYDLEFDNDSDVKSCEATNDDTKIIDSDN